MINAPKTIGILALSISAFLCSCTENKPEHFYQSGTGSDEQPVETYNCSRTPGTYTAAVSYDRCPNANHTDTCEVEVADCQLVRIYFLKHRLDEDNMAPVVIDSNGDATATDKKGNRYSIHLLSAPKEETDYRSYSEKKKSGKTGAAGSHPCGYPTQKGPPCRRNVTNGDHYCWQHDRQ